VRGSETCFSVQDVSSTLAIEIDGTGDGEFDVLNVLGDMTVSVGNLIVTLIGGCTPTDGDQFDILDFGSLTGHFDKLILPGGEEA